MLCPKARAYANQDWVKLRELTVGLPVVTEKVQEVELPRGPILTDRELKILTLVSLNGFSREQVAGALRISRGYLRVHLASIRKKLSRLRDEDDSADPGRESVGLREMEYRINSSVNVF